MSENTLTIMQKTVIDVVGNKIGELQRNQEILLPADYSPENAMKSAWLILQEVKDRNGKLALEVCTKNSIANALLSMVVQGLDPNKNQCYFIPYGSTLTLSRSYFGSMTVAKRVDPSIVDFFPEVVYEKDEFEYEKVRGVTRIVSHKQKLSNIDKTKIIAAYCIVLYRDGTERAEIMTMEQIEQAWRQSKMGVFDDKGALKSSSVHGKFTEEMCKKTIVNRICKSIINSSNDSSLLSRLAKDTDADMTKAEVKAEIEEKANDEIIDLDESGFEEVTEESLPAEDSSNDIPAKEGSQISLDQPPY
jgi:recombination protein RecT